MRYAALFHDIGKPYVYSEDEDGVGHFYGHWDKSEELFLKFAKRNLFDENDILQISKLIKYHDINFEKINEDELNKILKDNVYSSFDLLGIDIEEVLEEASYVSLFDEKKYMVVKNANIFCAILEPTLLDEEGTESLLRLGSSDIFLNLPHAGCFL